MTQLQRLTSVSQPGNLKTINISAAVLHTVLLGIIFGQLILQKSQDVSEIVCEDHPGDDTLTCAGCDSGNSRKSSRSFYENLNVQLLRLTTKLPKYMQDRLSTTIATNEDLNTCSNDLSPSSIPSSCTFWGEISTEDALYPKTVNLLVLVVVFTVVTIVAHIVYASRYKYYIEMIKSGANFYRWVEYGISASVMAVILAVLAGVRVQTSVWLVFAATAAQMFQGFVIEKAISQDHAASAQCIGALVVGWGLLIVVWYTIVEAWFSGLNTAYSEIERCRNENCSLLGGFVRNDNSTAPNENLKWLIIITIVLFSSFGFVNLWYFVHAIVSGSASARQSFPKYELAYICLSFIAKCLLILWCFFSIFQGELRWLQTGGLSSERLVHKFTSYKRCVE